MLTTLGKLYPHHPLEVEGASPFRVLIATVLASRTRDPVTNAAMRALWQRASTPEAILALPEAELTALIKPVGFPNQKAKQLRGLCSLLLERFGGKVPTTRDELMEFPGVGRKVANLMLNVLGGEPAICVDTHVHRVSGRLGWVATKDPEATELALMELVPRKYWAMLNRALVNHGQQVCQPLSPKCSVCPVSRWCPRIGVTKSR